MGQIALRLLVMVLLSKVNTWKFEWAPFLFFEARFVQQLTLLLLNIVAKSKMMLFLFLFFCEFQDAGRFFWQLFEARFVHRAHVQQKALTILDAILSEVAIDLADIKK